MDAPAILATDINVWYKRFHALKNVSMQIAPHEITAFIGASGSGKSTFLRCMNRMNDTIPFTRVTGKLRVGDREILDENEDVINLRKNVGMVFQNPVPFPKSIFDNVAYGLMIHGMRYKKRRSLLTRRQRSAQEVEASDEEIDQTVMQSLKSAALWEEVKDRLHLSAYRLSGGQQQRLCIARAIALQPEVLLLDEPCSELDPISTNQIEQTLLNLKKDYTIVIVTHNLQQAQRLSDQVAFFHSGKLVEVGPTEKMFSTPAVELTRDYVNGNFG